MYHTSPQKIEKIDKYGMFNDCLFFSDDVYYMNSSEDCIVYELDINRDKVIHESELFDESVINHIKSCLEVDNDEAEELLTGVTQHDDPEWSWFIQSMQGECAKKMGYEACESIDEQGTVYIVPCLDKLQAMKIFN